MLASGWRLTGNSLEGVGPISSREFPVSPDPPIWATVRPSSATSAGGGGWWPVTYFRSVVRGMPRALAAGAWPPAWATSREATEDATDGPIGRLPVAKFSDDRRPKDRSDRFFPILSLPLPFSLCQGSTRGKIRSLRSPRLISQLISGVTGDRMPNFDRSPSVASVALE